jgi:signal peptidase I
MRAPALAASLARSGARAIAVGLVPALLAGVTMRYLVPGVASGARGPLGVVAFAGEQYPAFLAVALFLLYAALVRYWSPWLPGGAYLRPPAVDAAHGAAPAAAGRGAGALFAVVAAAIVAALIVRAKIVAPYAVLSASMLPTLEPRDLVAGNKVAYAGRDGGVPRRGDVIVFPSAAVAITRVPGLPDLLVKRVIGLPGDRIEFHGASPVINGWEIPSCDAGAYVYVAPGGGELHVGRIAVEFLDDRSYLTVRAPPEEFHEYRVSPGEVFVLGDNRASSLDSRSWNQAHGGGVPVHAVQARAQWFVSGVTRSGRPDFGRLLLPVDGPRWHVEGMDAGALERGIAACLARARRDTHPPAASSTADSPASASR